MSPSMLKPAVGPHDHARGRDDAPVTLVEYGDYECPHCGRAYHVLEVVLAELSDSVRFVFRNFPLSNAHPDAELAAEAAESVGARAGEDAFWAMHDMLYENQDALSVDDLLGYAGAAGADPGDVADDLSSHAMQPRVRGDFTSGVRSGVNGTPTFFINGVRYDGEWSDADVLTLALADAAQATRPS